MNTATRNVPRAALRGLDVVSRHWIARQKHSKLGEIDAIARRLARPGTYFLGANYKWGCTVAVAPSPDGRSARLVRTLDWGCRVSAKERRQRRQRVRPATAPLAVCMTCIDWAVA